MEVKICTYPPFILSAHDPFQSSNAAKFIVPSRFYASVASDPAIFDNPPLHSSNLFLEYECPPVLSCALFLEYEDPIHS
jgi:hypothetical protein